MTPPLAVLQFVERMEGQLRDWSERPSHWIVRFTDGRWFQIDKADPAMTKQIKQPQPNEARHRRKLESK